MASEARPDIFIVLISSIIVELGKHRKFPGRKYRRIKVPKNTLATARYERGRHQPLRKGKLWATTYVSHGSIVTNWVRMFSILRVYRLEQTMTLSLCVALHGRYCNFSMDQGELANFQYYSITCHLPDDLSTGQFHAVMPTCGDN